MMRSSLIKLLNWLSLMEHTPTKRRVWGKTSILELFFTHEVTSNRKLSTGENFELTFILPHRMRSNPNKILDIRFMNGHVNLRDIQLNSFKSGARINIGFYPILSYLRFPVM